MACARASASRTDDGQRRASEPNLSSGLADVDPEEIGFPLGIDATGILDRVTYKASARENRNELKQHTALDWACVTGVVDPRAGLVWFRGDEDSESGDSEDGDFVEHCEECR